MIAFDIESLEGDQRVQAVKHLEESLDVLKLGSFQQFAGPDIKTELKKEDPAEIEPDPQEAPACYPTLYNGLVPTCSECQQTFPTLGTLDAHMKKLHNETYRENVSKSKAEIARKSKAIVSSNSPKVEKKEKNLVSQEIGEKELTSKKIEKDLLTSNDIKKELLSDTNIQKQLLISNDIEKERSTPNSIEEKELVKKKLKKKALVTKKLSEKKVNSPKAVQNLENQNQNEGNLFPCADCEKSFGNKNSLRKHKVCHTDRNKCQTCGKGFSQKRDLENHHKNQSSCVMSTSGDSSNIRGA